MVVFSIGLRKLHSKKESFEAQHMAHEADPKRVIDDIRKEIEDAKGTHIWSDYVNALKLVSQVIFTRSSGFILEFIQNAEDAALGLSTDGVFEIKFNKERLKIIHNSRPFTNEDVNALCGIRSSKKPEKGTLGYLGIGFKSVFKITDRPEVYSNCFQFKFDRDYWDNPNIVPWQVIPIWMDQPVETIDPTSTTFIVPYREKSSYFYLLKEVKNLRTELYLFLRWLKRVEVTDEVAGQKWAIENKGETKDGFTVLKQDGKEQWFKFFRRVVEVPERVRDDRLTQEQRQNVIRRDIAIAFSVDSGRNLAPSVAGAMYGEVYTLSCPWARRGAAQNSRYRLTSWSSRDGTQLTTRRSGIIGLLRKLLTYARRPSNISSSMKNGSISSFQLLSSRKPRDLNHTRSYLALS